MTLSRWAFVATLVLTLATLAFPLALFGSPPNLGSAPMAPGFQTPILALEFAEDIDDIAFLRGDDAAALRAWLVDVQFKDWFFPVAYAGMAAVFFLGMALRGRFLAVIGIGLALATIPADWQENATINDILAEIENPLCGEDIEPADGRDDVVLRDCLPRGYFDEASAEAELVSYAFDTFLPVRIEMLRIDTWIKWGLIAAYAAWLAAMLWMDRRRILAIPAALGALSIAATWISGSNGHVAELMGILLIPMMLTFPVAAVMYLRDKPAKTGTPTGEDSA
ncbi:MAG: hypothetical protein ACJA0K_001486 [Maricaulis maris]|jgi:hypothetical protein